MATKIFTLRSNWSDTQDADLHAEYTGPADTYNILRDKAIANNYTMVHTGMWVGQIWWTGNSSMYAICRSFVWIRTDVIPAGAPIESASLQIKPASLATDKNFDVVIQKGIEEDGNGIPLVHHNPVVTADYNRLNVEGNGGSVNTLGAATGQFLIIPLNETGIGWINGGEGGITKFCLRSSDDIAGIPPTGWFEYINFNSGNTFTTESKPKLVVAVTLSIPTATVQEPTDIEPTKARFNGTIENNGWWIDNYGFEWKKGIDGDVYSVTVGSSSNQEISTFDYFKIALIPNTTYYYRAWGNNDAGKGYSEWVEFYTGTQIVNTKAVRDSTQTAIKLYGEITTIMGAVIIEKGFEYLVQNEEPTEESTGIEVIKERPAWIEEWEIGEYNCHEYEGNDEEWEDRLYLLPENTIWWFRAYCKDNAETPNKYTAPTWMKNVPSLTTSECTEVGAQEAKGNGELTDKGANIVTKRGFRIIKEYAGDLFGASTYRFDGFEGELQIESMHNENGILIGFIWKGNLYRDSLHEDSGGYELGIYDKILGGGFLGEGFGLYLRPNDAYKIVAIAGNQLGMGFGEEVDLTTGQNILPSDDENVSETSAEKTITLGTIPEGDTVTRIGIRLGRTEGCNEIHVFEDGSWTSGQSHTFYITGFVPGATYYKMPYIIIDHGDYEEEVLAIPDYRNPERREEWLEDYPLEVFPDVDEDDLDQSVTDASVGDISYRTIIKEIKCEKIGEQSFIDRWGRRRSKTITNHLIQSRANCITIVDEYIEKFQILKLKVAIDYDIPIPFEREDVILLGDGKVKYREDTEGLVAFKADGEGEIEQQDFILAKIRKIDSRFISGLETISSLELEV